MAIGLTRKQTIALTVTVTILVVAVAGAWLLESVARGDANVQYRIAVVRDEETIGVLDLGQLRALPQQTIKMQGEVQEGPTLLDALASVGVTEFASLTVTGLGVRDSGRIDLGAGEIDERVLLDFSLRGTVKICGPEILWEDRVRDLETIEVR